MTTTSTTNPAINEEKLGQFMQKVLSDFGGEQVQF